MSNLDDITLGDVGRGLRRYQPFIGVAVVILLAMVLLPGADDGGDSEDLLAGDLTGGSEEFSAGTSTADGAGANGGGLGGEGLDGGADTTGGDGTTVTSGASGSTDGSGGAVGADAPSAASGDSAAGSTGGTGGADTTPSATLPEGGGATGQPAEANCDQATGRIRVPALFAPPCLPVPADNGGATARGVTGDKIVIVDYDPQGDAATEAALTAAGASDTDEDSQATLEAYFDYFEHHYNTYGREVELIDFDASGESDDDAAAKADAIQIATDIEPFLVFGSNSLAFVTELANREVLCVCTTSQPQETYEELSPYVGYTTLMSSTQGYIQRAEYIGKRLAGRNAAHAGTSDGIPLSTQERKFGLLYFETEDNAYKAGVDFFEQELAKYGVELAARLAFTYPLSNVQSQARPFIQKLKSEGVTSVIFSGDPITPAIFTSEASNQLYFPEWIITGSALTDTAIFARTYDQKQWNKAFGISFLTARFPEEQGEAHTVHQWHHGAPPQASNTYAVIYASPRTIFTGIHMAGPQLTTESFVKGLFSYPPTGGYLTAPYTSWGDHGIWPFVDYTQYDDVTEIWWDPAAVGPDEVGNEGAGLYRYVDGGVRYLPGEQPSSDPKVFVNEGTVTIYDERPESDRPPQYEHQPHD